MPALTPADLGMDFHDLLEAFPEAMYLGETQYFSTQSLMDVQIPGEVGDFIVTDRHVFFLPSPGIEALLLPSFLGYSPNHEVFRLVMIVVDNDCIGYVGYRDPLRAWKLTWEA